jgi:hypothetical protein
MARRKQAEAPSPGDGLPPELAPDVVVISDFVADDEAPPDYWTTGSGGYTDASWRRITALRRWQHAVDAWGAARGVSVRELRAAGLRPVTPPPFRR